MAWTLTQGEEGLLLCRLTGHIAEPFGVFTDSAKAIHVLEVMEWADVLMNAGVVPKPPVFIPKKRRRVAK